MVEPFLKVTLPVGVVLPEVGETLAVKVTADPAMACVEDTASLVVVEMLAT